MDAGDITGSRHQIIKLHHRLMNQSVWAGWGNREQQFYCALSQWTGLKASQGENCRVSHLYLCPCWLFFKPQTSYSAAPGSSYLSRLPFSINSFRGATHYILLIHFHKWTPNHMWARPVDTPMHTWAHTHSGKHVNACLHTHIMAFSVGN